MSKELATVNNSSTMLLDPNVFDRFKEISKMLATSSMVPDHFHGAENMGNCMIALDLASRMDVSPFMLMQRMYTVHGKPGFEAQFVIAMINKQGRFEPLRWRFEGEGNDLVCICYARDIKSNDICEAECSVQMAIDEGWWSKKGSKWPTMTKQMLRYRSAAFFGRLFAPDALMGMSMVDELDDIAPKVIKVDHEEINDVNVQSLPESTPEEEIKITKTEKAPEKPKTKPKEEKSTNSKKEQVEDELDPFAGKKRKFNDILAGIRQDNLLDPKQNVAITDAIKAISSPYDLAYIDTSLNILKTIILLREQGNMKDKDIKQNVDIIVERELEIAALYELNANLNGNVDPANDGENIHKVEKEDL